MAVMAPRVSGLLTTTPIQMPHNNMNNTCISLADLGDALSDVLGHLPLNDRLTVACVSRELHDYVYSHHELWSSISATTCNDDRLPDSPFQGTLKWAAARGSVKHLRAAIHEADARHRDASSPQALLDTRMDSLARCVAALPTLASLSLRLSDGTSARCPPARLAALLHDAAPSLRQLSIVCCDIPDPLDAGRLPALTTLTLHASGGAVAAPASLPPCLKRLSISGLKEATLPAALATLPALESLSLDWASSVSSDDEVTPDWTLLGATGTVNWTAHLTHLSLGYFAADAMPAVLPPTLRSLELQWNLQTTEAGLAKATSFDVDAFHASFSALEPLTALTHLNLNRALGAWGLPRSVLKLTQLQSLGATGGCRAAVAPQLRAFPHLRRLDLEILDAAEGWEAVAALRHLQELRLGKAEAAEVYAQPEVQSAMGRGLVRLLPALPALKVVKTEGMLLPATAGCARWARLLGLEAPEEREGAERAVASLQAKGVALDRWYSFPFVPGKGVETAPWDEGR